MALWLVRAGRQGEYEQKFFGENKLYVTWGGLNVDLSTLTKQALVAELQRLEPNAPKGKWRNNAGQIWPFAHVMEPGDWVVVPYKTRPAINVAELTGPYVYDRNAQDPFFHSRTVRWIARDIPRTNFDQDLLYSFGAFMTICRIERNDAERRVRQMAAAEWQIGSSRPTPSSEPPDAEESLEGGIDLEQAARDQIAKPIIAKYQGHGLARLVDAILRVKGYTTYLSPEGPDKGIDILASAGPLGCGSPRICVQVKSGDSPVDAPTLNQLIGAMANVQADQGLLVSWGGFKSSVDKERANQFFRVRLWDQKSVIDELLNHYDQLDEEFRTVVPLKRIWIIADEESINNNSEET